MSEEKQFLKNAKKQYNQFLKLMMFPSTYLNVEFRRTIVGRPADGRWAVVGGTRVVGGTGKKAFDRGGLFWPPGSIAKDDRTAPKKKHLIEAAPFGRFDQMPSTPERRRNNKNIGRPANLLDGQSLACL